MDPTPEEIAEIIAKQYRDRLLEITEDDRNRAMIRILNDPGTIEQIQNAWECLTQFCQITKAMGSDMEERALRAAVFINKFRSTYEVYGPHSDSGRTPVDQSTERQ